LEHLHDGIYVRNKTVEKNSATHRPETCQEETKFKILPESQQRLFPSI
jgi:hypothetical protein